MCHKIFFLSFLIVLFITLSLCCMERSPSPTSTDALRRAIEIRDCAAAELAIRNNANTRERLTPFEPIIHHLARTNNSYLLNILLEKPAWGLVNHRDSLRRTPLHVAAMGNAFDTAQVLLKNRATIDPKDEYGSTPLHYAAWFGDRKFVEELLAYRAHIEEVNGRNNTPLDLALQFDRIENIKALLLAGAYIKDGWRTKIWLNFEPLEYYILFGDFEEVQELLEFHPALASGQALAYAAGQGHIGITQLLLCYDISPFPAQKVILDILAQRALYPEQQAIYMNIGSLLQDRITYLEGLTQLVINPQLNSYFNLLPPDIRRLLHPTACPFMYGK